MNITVPNSNIIKKLAYDTYENYQPYLVPFKKMMQDCYAEFKVIGEVNRNCGIDDFKNIRAATVDYDVLYACYTVHSQLDKPDAEPDIVDSGANEVYVFDVISEQYNPRITNAEMQLSIHHAKNILNPYSFGYSLKKGFTNMFRLKKTVKRLLPPPYETNCKDYMSSWKARGGKGPTSEKECIEECQKNSSLTVLGCLTDLFKVTGNERYCRQEADDKVVLAAAHECVLKNCRPACYEVSYEVLKDTLSIDTSSNCFVAGIYGKIGFNNVIRVEIKLDGMQTTTYTYSPKYQ
ncbi:degenerin-like protein, partial [Trichonephila clavata]